MTPADAAARVALATAVQAATLALALLRLWWFWVHFFYAWVAAGFTLVSLWLLELLVDSEFIRTRFPRIVVNESCYQTSSLLSPSSPSSPSMSSFGESSSRVSSSPRKRTRVPLASGPGSVSVIIPTFNNADTIAYTLRSLADQLHADARCELIIVDAESSDATLKIIADTISSINYNNNKFSDRKKKNAHSLRSSNSSSKGRPHKNEQHSATENDFDANEADHDGDNADDDSGQNGGNDNHSSHFRLIEDTNLQILEVLEADRSWARQCNVGAMTATGSVLVFVHPATTVPKNLMPAIAQNMGAERDPAIDTVLRHIEEANHLSYLQQEQKQQSNGSEFEREEGARAEQIFFDALNGRRRSAAARSKSSFSRTESASDTAANGSSTASNANVLDAMTPKPPVLQAPKSRVVVGGNFSLHLVSDYFSSLSSPSSSVPSPSSVTSSFFSSKFLDNLVVSSINFFANFLSLHLGILTRMHTFFIDAEVFRKLNGFADQIILEDYEMTCLIARSGGKLVHVETSSVISSSLSSSSPTSNLENTSFASYDTFINSYGNWAAILGIKNFLDASHPLVEMGAIRFLLLFMLTHTTYHILSVFMTTQRAAKLLYSFLREQSSISSRIRFKLRRVPAS